MAHEIFISYSRHDKDLVHPFVQQINEAIGKEDCCWIDMKGIESGEEFEDIIIQAIDDCRVVLFMLSNSSLKSKWTKREVYYAEGEGKRIVPVLIDGDKLRGWFKFHFGNVDYINIQSEGHKTKLIENLQSWLGVEVGKTQVSKIANKTEEIKHKEKHEEEESRRKAEDAKKKQKIEAEKLRHESCSPMSDISFNINNIFFIMKPVKGGSFTMGSLPDEEGTNDDEYPHNITISDFYILETPVTQALWQTVMGNNPSYFNNPNGPVENVNWFECQQFVEKLNFITGRNFSLPTEAQWEYAAKGGQSKTNNKFSGSNNIEDVAWFIENSGNSSHNVKQKGPNELGLYDMSGNVSEWCSDWYDEAYYKISPDNNPQGPDKGYTKVVRGGSWHSFKGLCRVSYRHEREPEKKRSYNGFRIVLQH